MLRLGITGGIGSGKSTVAAMLLEMGFPVLNADSVAHHLSEPGQEAYDDVVREFGRSILQPDGYIDRAKLAAIVFADRAKLDRLNAILHPRVGQVMVRQFDEWERAGTHPAAFAEAALMVEAGLQKELDGLVVAWCRPEQQVERLRARGMSEEEARRRIAAQLPIDEKLKYATEKIDCSGSLEDTRRQVEDLSAKLRHGSRKST